MRNLEHPVRSAVVIVAILAALVGGGAAWSSLDPLSSPSFVNAVVGGGHWDMGACFTFSDGTQSFCAGSSRNFSLDAHGIAPEGVAVGTFRIGGAGDSGFSRVRITCMNVVGNSAVLGGYVVASSSPAIVGLPAFVYVIDNGGPGDSAVADKVSPLAVLDASEPVPAGFPRKCGAPGSPFFGFTDLLAGDVSIHSGL
jgi:hypothetical protein